MRWVRRNGRALLALPFVAAAVFWTADDGLIERWRDDRRTIPVVAAGERGSWHGSTFVVRDVEVIGHRDTGDLPIVPVGTQGVLVTVDATPPDAVDGNWCAVALLDADGRRFGASPIDVVGGPIDVSCLADVTDPGAAWVEEYIFLLPDGAVPRALRLGDLERNDAVDLLLDGLV